ncbi:MAG TPA: hypothetical protein PKH07_10915, partial [bacterium]|nr:hypothetical protein [bacterium]
VPIPATDLGTDLGSDFFVTFKTSGSLTKRSRFSIEVKKIVYGHGLGERSLRTRPVSGSQFNQRPYIELLNPLTGDKENRLYSIRWSDFDPDSDATIRLYYVSRADVEASSDINDWTKQTLALNISEDDETDIFHWDVSRLGVGEWYILALIRDEKSSMYAVSPGYLKTANQPPFLEFIEPDGIDDRIIQGEPYSLSWVDSDPENNAYIDLYLDMDGNAATDGAFDITVATGLREDDEADFYLLDTSKIPGGSYFAV